MDNIIISESFIYNKKIKAQSIATMFINNGYVISSYHGDNNLSIEDINKRLYESFEVHDYSLTRTKKRSLIDKFLCSTFSDKTIHYKIAEVTVFSSKELDEIKIEIYGRKYIQIIKRMIEEQKELKDNKINLVLMDERPVEVEKYEFCFGGF